MAFWRILLKWMTFKESFQAFAEFIVCTAQPRHVYISREVQTKWFKYWWEWVVQLKTFSMITWNFWNLYLNVRLLYHFSTKVLLLFCFDFSWSFACRTIGTFERHKNQASWTNVTRSTLWALHGSTKNFLMLLSYSFLVEL